MEKDGKRKRRKFSAEYKAETVRLIQRSGKSIGKNIWRLRTPEFEVLESSARQNAGKQSGFNPELCRLYPDIRGVRIGRGLSKRILIQLGDLPGAEEHLFLAIEMARVGQQVFQVPAGFETRFAKKPEHWRQFRGIQLLENGPGLHA